MVSARVLLLAPLVILAAAPVAARQDPARADGWVVIPVDDYRALRAKAFPVDPAPPPPPVDAAVTRIDYDLDRSASGSVTGTAAVTVDVLKEGWVAHPGPRRAPRRRRSRRWPARLAGRSAVTARAAVQARPLGAHAERRAPSNRRRHPWNRSSVPPAPAAAMQVTLTMPRVGVELGVSNAWVASTSETGGQSRWIAHGRGTRTAHLHLAAPRRPAPRRTAAAPARQRHAPGGPGRGRHAGHAPPVRVDVISGLASAVTLAMPRDLRVNSRLGRDGGGLGNGPPGAHCA